MANIAPLLMTDNYETRIALAPFCSVIYVSTSDHIPISIFHASFGEFIVHPSRCERHFLDASRGHQMLAIKCLRYLNQFPSRDISNLEDSMTGWPRRGGEFIPEGL